MPKSTPSTPAEPPLDCPLCPRLVQFRTDTAKQFPDWHNAPVDSFGAPDARLLIVGLAPGLRGANRTGRPFTGDYAGDLLYATLAKFGFSSGTYDCRPDDGLALTEAMITNAVRCVPPENKPTGPEINACRDFLTARIDALPRLTSILALGKIAFDSTVKALGRRLANHKFGHGVHYGIEHGGRPLDLFASYHCSRYNTNTGRLTEAMFEDVFRAIREKLD